MDDQLGLDTSDFDLAARAALYVVWFRIKEPSPREVDCVDVSDQFQRTSKN
jgi:hypothetical protein